MGKILVSYVASCLLSMDFSPILVTLYPNQPEEVLLMSRKRKQYERDPANDLNDLINELTDGEFADWMGLWNSNGKAVAFRNLQVWHRGRKPCDYSEERRTFPAYNLNELRKKAT